MAGCAMDTLLALLSLIGEPNASDVAESSRARLTQVAVDSELVGRRIAEHNGVNADT
jgi:hypothetical protein